MKPRIINANDISMRVPCAYDGDGNIMVSMSDVIKAIAQTPTAAVTCEECRYYKPSSPKCGNCHLTTSIMHPNDFCSRGKRKVQNDG